MGGWGGGGRGGDKLLFSQGKAHRAPKLPRNTDAIFRKRGRLWSSSGTRTSHTHTHTDTCIHVRICIFTFANQPQLRCSCMQMKVLRCSQIVPGCTRYLNLYAPFFFFFYTHPSQSEAPSLQILSLILLQPIFFEDEM